MCCEPARQRAGSGGVFKNRRNALAALETPAASRTLLAQNRPNLFNPSTTLGFTLAGAGPVMLTLRDSRGRLLHRLGRGQFQAGPHAPRLDARGLASGGYIYRLAANGEVRSRRLTVLK